MPRTTHTVLSALALGTASPALAFDVTPTSDPTALGAQVFGASPLPDQEIIPTGNPGSVGVFIDGPFGLERGVLLSTGLAVDALPPDDEARAGHAFGTSGASTFCDHLQGAGAFYDAAHVRFRWTSTVAIESIRFHVAFATEEVGEPPMQVGDVAAFFVDGVLVETIGLQSFGPTSIVGGTGMQYDGVAEAFFGGDVTASPTVDFVICDGTDALGDSALLVGPLEICADGECNRVEACALSDLDGDQMTACDDCDDLDAFRSANQPEICNGIDDDCDGGVDEDTAAGGACQVGVGACARGGAVYCTESGVLQCDAVAGAPSEELCGDAEDSNCDGDPDDGCDGTGGSRSSDAGGAGAAGGGGDGASAPGGAGLGADGSGAGESGGSSGGGSSSGGSSAGAGAASSGGAGVGGGLGVGASAPLPDGPKYPGCNCEQPGLSPVESTSAAAALVIVLAYVRRRRGQVGRGPSQR
jgi:hypothetical protein